MKLLKICLAGGLLVILSACGKQDVEQQANDWHVQETFNVGENVYVRAMEVDGAANGLWVGTSVGVMEIDLSTLNLRNSYTREHGLANEYVFGIMVDSQGRKWFGTNGGGTTTLKDGVWKTYFPMHGVADYWIYSFTEQKDGTIWIGTWAGLNALNPKSGDIKTYFKELVNEWVYGLGVDSQDRVWVGTEGGVNMYDGQKWYTWTHADGLGAENKADLPPSSNTGLGTRSRHDLSVLSEGGVPTYNPNYVFTLLVAKDDKVWAGTWGGGAGVFDGNSWRNFTSHDGLAGDIVYTIVQDRDGAVWFGTNRGLSRYDGKNWMSFSKQNGLLEDNVYSIAIDGANRVWVGTRNGVTMLAKTIR